MRRFVLPAVLLLAAFSPSASAQLAAKWNVEFGGNPAGEATYELKADGSFASTSVITIANIRIADAITGKMVDGQIVEYRLEAERTGQPKTVLEFKDQKLKVTREGASQEVDIAYTGKLYLANVNPQYIAATLQAADWTKKEPQKIEAYMLDAGAVIPLEITPLRERTVPAGTAKVFKSMLGPTEAHYALSDKGVVVGMDVPSQRIRIFVEGWKDVFEDPLAKFPELSQATHQVQVETGVKMTTRDGVELVADVYRPAEEGRYPVILTRTPYGRATVGLDGRNYASRGYVFVAQDVRGMGDSGGEWDPFVNERKDGYDTVDWVASQPWSNGRVGMIGASYGGLVQWAAAVEGHPALKCLIPQVSTPDAMRNIPYDHGTFFLFGSLWWARIVSERQADLAGVGQSLPGLEKLATLPLSKVDDEVFGRNIPFFDKWLEREGLNHWQGFDWVADLPKTNVPALHISGWWDGDGVGTKVNWQTLRAAGRKNQWLIYGPWTHAFNTTRRLGDVDYGPDAIIELDSLSLRWFDTWLKEKSVGLDDVPKVRVFVTGANRWVELDDWPASTSEEKALYLFADGPANGRTSMGELRDRPADRQEPSRYLFNPANADIPKELMSIDPNQATTKVALGENGYDNEVLVFRTAPMTEAMTLTGPVEVDLFIESTARDTDLYVSLLEQDADGTYRAIGMSGKLRLAFRDGLEQPVPLVPGDVVRVKVEPWDVAHEFKPGTRFAIMITSGSFPLFARNLGTGEPIKEATRMVVQVNTIHHDAARPSAVRFRVLPSGKS